MIKYLNGDFDDVINGHKILVDFYADWCGPCRMLSSVLEKIEGIDIVKVNVDKYPLIAQRYGVMNIPTLIIFERGQVVKSHIGLINEELLNDFIK